MNKRQISLFVAIVMIMSLTACSRKTVEWNGKTENMCDLLVIHDITNLYGYVGFADYVFVGTVSNIEHNVIPDRINQHGDSYSEYKITVDKNLKGNLVKEIICRKMGGFRKDGTMLLVSAEVPDGRMIMDSGLPEVGKQYIFLAYAQPDGSLTLSEIFDNREYNEDLLLEYTDYIENEIPCDRQRFVSMYAE